MMMEVMTEVVCETKVIEWEVIACELHFRQLAAGSAD
jgi:hypothetical protein